MTAEDTNTQEPGAANNSWGGRFAAAPAQAAMAFTDSQHFDRAFYRQDILASMAHARMLASQGILTTAEMEEICGGLERVRAEIDRGDFQWRPELEDVHMNIESRLTQLIGETGKKLHTARSRNDQVCLTYRLFISDCLGNWRKALVALCQTLCQAAAMHQTAILPGMTHFQPAQPVSLAHYLLAYATMFQRDAERIGDALRRTRVSPLGAAALAGSTYPIAPAQVAASLGLPDICANSMDAVADRDFVLEALFCASLIAMHMSRLCEEIIIWSNPAFDYVLLPDAYSTGSSIMPQKKNPDIAELIRGKTGRVYGSLMAMLTVMKSLPLAYNRDMQEDKEGFLDTDKTILSCLSLLAALMAELRFKPDSMARACRKGYLNATELADYLVGKGMPFRDAHHATGKLVALAEKKGVGLEELELGEFQGIAPLIQMDVYPLLTCEACVNRRESPGGTGPASVRRQLERFEQWFAQAAMWD